MTLHFPLRVFFCGAQSTGKTTLLNDVIKYVNLQSQAEIARKLIRELGITREQFCPRKHPDVFEDLQIKILTRQCTTESANGNIDYIMDRGIDPLVYVAMELGNEALNRCLILNVSKQCIERYRTSLIFVMEPHKEFIVDDGVRLVLNIEESRIFTTLLKNLLTELDIPFIVISSTDQLERIAQVLCVIKKCRPDLLNKNIVLNKMENM